MITEQELKTQCTPDIIKKMVELAEGFKFKEYDYYNTVEFGTIYVKAEQDEMFCTQTLLPLLIHRAVEGWNKKQDGEPYLEINESSIWSCSYSGNAEEFGFEFEHYQPENLTQLECACLHCMINILKEEVKEESNGSKL